MDVYRGQNPGEGLAAGANRILVQGLYFICVYGVPLLIAVLSLLALCFWSPEYPAAKAQVLRFQMIHEDAPRGVGDLAARLAQSPLIQGFESHRSTSPFWLRFVVPANATSASPIVELNSRHVSVTQCWNGADLSSLGEVNRVTSSGGLRAAKGGFALALPALQAPLTVICKSSFQGPAHVELLRWDATDFGISVAKFHRDSGLLDGGLGVLAMFVLLTALVNRQWLYVIFAAWLAASLRMAAVSAGWDTQWLEHMIPWDWVVPLRKWTAVLYYVLTVTLFARLFHEDLKRVGFSALFRILHWSCLVLIAAASLPFATFLPVLWMLTAFNVTTLVFFLSRIVAITNSRVAMWYALSLVLSLSATFYEVIAAALGIREWLGSVNSVTAALFSSIIVALAIAEQMRQEHLARVEAQTRLTHAYRAIPIGLFSLDRAGFVSQTNPAFNAMMGVASTAAAHWSDFFDARGWTHLQEHIASAQGADIELRAVSTDAQSARCFLVGATLAHDRIEGSVQDITERVAAAERLSFLADHDPLTGILNRRGIERVLADALQSNQAGSRVAVGYLDLDRFKLINDLFGHSAGDEVLKQVCSRITNLLCASQKLGRVGGDEFVIVFENSPIADAALVCRSVVELIGTVPYQLGDRAFQIKGSIGLVELDLNVNLADVIPLADRACREAKKGQANGLVVYGIDAPAVRERNDELRLVQRFGASTVPDGLFLLMQPIMSVAAPYGSLDFEVLLRLREADQSITPAGKIIGAAEANGRISVIDRWVLSHTLEWLSANESQLATTRFVCVNLSGGSLNDEKFVEDVYAMLANAGKTAERLCLEITESVALHDLDYTRRFIDRTRSFGTRIALDDFGAGYTSFSYLRELPADAVKIDGTFVKGVLSHPANLAIVAAIVELARNLGMKSIAEWVEDCATLEALTAIGVDYIQGYAIAMPQEPARMLLANSAASFIKDTRVAQFVRDSCVQAKTDNLWEHVADLSRERLH